MGSVLRISVTETVKARVASAEKQRMGWLWFGVLYSVSVIVKGRRRWRGCQWLFWATIALGLTMSAIGLTGWAADELVSRRETWLAWLVVFALFGAVALSPIDLRS